MKYFSDTLPFYKANFHCHTTCSDGRMTPTQSMAMYREAGYDVLSLTDHRSLTVPEDVPEGLLMIPGIELDLMLPGQAVHILGLGVSADVLHGWSRSCTPQETIDRIRAAGGRAILAHPAWSLNTPEFIASLKGLIGTEIWNSVSTLPINADRADSSSLLDTTWSNYGCLMPVFANDDTHRYGAEFAVGATMVQAESFTQQGILDALDAGRFYATQGPRIHQITMEDGQITVTCSPADTIIFYSNTFWVDGRTRFGSGMTESTYTINPMDRFVRVEIRDREGKRAWSAPIAIS